jgi:outer membrane protein
MATRRRELERLLYIPLLILLGVADPVAAASHPFRVALVPDGPSERLDEVQKVLVKEVLDLTRGRWEVRFAEDARFAGNWTVASVKAAVENALADHDVDLVIATGFISSAELGRLKSYPKPCLALFVIDPELQGLPLRDGKTGVHNFSYLARPSVVERDLQVFHEIVPFTHVGVLYNALIDEVVPELKDRVVARAKEGGIEAVPLPVGTSVDAALAAIPAGIEAVYMTPCLNISLADWDRLVQGLIARKLPTFSSLGRPEVDRGILAGTAPPQDATRYGRRVALTVQRILQGEDPATFSVTVSVGERLAVNMTTARAIDFSPSWAVLTEAELIGAERTEAERKLSLGAAVNGAIEANLDLAAEQRQVSAGAEDVRKARSELRPQVEGSSLVTWIDKDRARASLGAQPERRWSASATLQQLLYSDAARGNVEIQRAIQTSREAERDALRLDIALDAATAYIDVLRAKNLERIQRENLQVIRANLELAQVRRTIGASGPSEVYRWESQIATGRKDVITANSQRNVAEIALNRVLHRPAEESFLTEETDLDSPEVITSGGRIFQYQDNPADFRVLREFLVEVGLRGAPELRSLDAGIQAEQRLLLVARRAFWSPTAAFQADLTQNLADGGDGSSGPTGLPIQLEQPDNTNFTLGFKLSLPLYQGGARGADEKRAAEDLARLQIQRQSAAEQIEQRIRSSLHIAGASHASIALSRSAAEAAHKNLDLVTDAYSRGAISILDLLDAQNAALVADLGSANSVHDFLLDLMQVERSVSTFTILMTPEQREGFYQQLDAYFEKAGRRRNQR